MRKPVLNVNKDQRRGRDRYSMCVHMCLYLCLRTHAHRHTRTYATRYTYEVWLLNNETAHLEGALEGWGNKRVVSWVAANLLYSRTKTRFRRCFSMCAAAV